MQRRIIIFNERPELVEVYSKYFQEVGLNVIATFLSFGDLLEYFVSANKSLERRVLLESSIVLLSTSSVDRIDMLEAARSLKKLNSSSRIVLATTQNGTQIEFIKDAFDSVISKPFLMSELIRTIDDLFLESRDKDNPEAKKGRVDRLDSKSGVVIGLVDTTKFFLEAIEKTNRSFAAVCESNAAQFFLIDDYRHAVERLAARGIRLRVILDVTTENYEISKEISKIMEVRHLNAVKGSFCLTDDSYLSATEPLDRVELVPKLLYSSLQSVVNQHQFLFEELWKDAIPAKKRFEEIDLELRVDQEKTSQPFPLKDN